MTTASALDELVPGEWLETFTGHVTEIAPALLGCRIRTDLCGTPTEVVLTEVEAYAADADPASHAYRGRTARNGAMFEGPGTLYVYRSYGIHWCANITVGLPGRASAVLLRGGEPGEGVGAMEGRRGRSDHIADGPGKLTQALGITGDHDGTSVFDGPVYLLPRDEPVGTIVATPRVGISKAADRLWRYVVAG